MGWRTVEITNEDYLQLYLNNLLIRRDLEKIIINLSDIDTLLLNNYKIKLSVQLLNALTSNNINVVIMDNKQMPYSFLVPISGHHMSLKVLQKQVNWTHQYKGIIWQNIIENKLHNQAQLLKRQGKERGYTQLVNLAKTTKVYDITNREGHGAKIYWNRLFEAKFIRDQKCFYNPLLNNMLNYGYSILHSLIARSIIKKGLDPRFSFFHKNFSNFFALASDLIEPFRPLVDEIVCLYQKTDIFSIKIREEIVKRLTQKVRVQKQLQYLNNAIDIVIDQIVSGNGYTWVALWD